MKTEPKDEGIYCEAGAAVGQALDYLASRCGFPHVTDELDDEAQALANEAQDALYALAVLLTKQAKDSRK